MVHFVKFGGDNFEDAVIRDLARAIDGHRRS
jgi:hypothetical protein